MTEPERGPGSFWFLSGGSGNASQTDEAFEALRTFHKYRQKWEGVSRNSPGDLFPAQNKRLHPAFPEVPDSTQLPGWSGRNKPARSWSECIQEGCSLRSCHVPCPDQGGWMRRSSPAPARGGRHRPAFPSASRKGPAGATSFSNCFRRLNCSGSHARFLDHKVKQLKTRAHRCAGTASSYRARKGAGLPGPQRQLVLLRES